MGGGADVGCDVCAGTLDTASLRLLESAELGDSEGVLRAIGEGGKLDAGHPGWLDYTPLHMASLHGHLEVAQLLITAGATVASLACDGATPAAEAASLPAPKPEPSAKPFVLPSIEPSGDRQT